MSRMLAILAVLVGGGPAFAWGADAPEDVLAGKDLVRSGAMFLLRAEGDVKKAADAAETKLKEYLRASAWEKDSVRSASEKKTLAANLTKQRTAMKQQMDQVLPQIQAQVRMLQQQQSALNQQRSSMGRYGGRFGRMAYSGPANELAYEINLLQAQSRQITAEYNEMGYRIQLLDPKPGSDIAKAQALEKPKASAKERKDDYAEALAALRKLVDETKTQYGILAGNADVKAALAALDQHSAKVKHTLGPSKRFLDTLKALEQAETKLATNTLDPPATTRPASTTKRKGRTGKRK